MSVTDGEQTLEAPAVGPPAAEYETCEQCGAPVDTNQRYCVVCGTRRTQVYDPAARFLNLLTHLWVVSPAWEGWAEPAE